VGNLRSLDSFQFLSMSLENLLLLLLKSGRDKSVHTTKFLADHDLVFAKGVCPYAHMTGNDKFQEMCLPPIESFYDKLNNEPSEQKDYECAKEIWLHFGIQTLQQYHDHYLKSDVLLLADVMKNFRSTIYRQHGLDHLHFTTLPSLAWTSALRYNKAKLELTSDPDIYLMVKNNMRGGIASISHNSSCCHQ